MYGLLHAPVTNTISREPTYIHLRLAQPRDRKDRRLHAVYKARESPIKATQQALFMARKATPQGRCYIRYNVPWPCIARFSLAAYRSAPFRGTACISDVLVHMNSAVAVVDSSDSAMAC